MNFVDTYTTEDIKGKDPIKEKDKLVLSNDAYALGKLLECLINKGLR